MKSVKKAKVISVVNHKGGVGKTTTTLTVGSILAKRGFRVLCIDLDAQANLTLSLLRDDAEYSTLSESILQDKPLPIINIFENFDIVPSSLDLTKLELSMMGVLQREYIISDKIKSVLKDYDYIFIDCPPSLGIYTVNALVASDYALVTMTPEILPYKGLGSVIILIKQITERMNPGLKCAGILFTKLERTNNLTSNVQMAVRKVYGGLAFKTTIRKNVSVAEAPSERKALLEYAPNSKAFIDYVNFTDEFLERIDGKSGQPVTVVKTVE